LHEVVYVSGACNNLYRQRTGSAMHRMLAGGNYPKARRYFLQWLQNYLRENGLVDTSVHQLLKKAIRECDKPLFYRLQQGFYNRLKRVMQRVKTA
jgi:hypothetical protein